MRTAFFFTLSFTTLVLIGCGSDAAHPLIGKWNSDTVMRGSIQERQKIVVEQERIVVHQTCSIDGVGVTVKVASPIVLTEGQIQISEAHADSAQLTTPTLTHDCTAEVKKVDLLFRINAQTADLGEADLTRDEGFRPSWRWMRTE